MPSAARPLHSGRRLSVAVALGLFLYAAPARAQACPEGLPRTATLGIGLLHCVGGSCRVNARDGHVRRHEFSTEPRVWGLDPAGPSARRLHEGDQITSIDGVLITTREGGRRLANLKPGVAVRLGIRRDGAETSVRVVPEPGCNAPALAVTASAARPDVRPPARTTSGGDLVGPGVYFGMELDCDDCGWRRVSAGWRWHAQEPIPVASVVPGGPAQRAGIRPGDVMLAIDGEPVTTPAAGRFIIGLRNGEPVRLKVRRGGRTLIISVVPQLRVP